MGIWWFKWTLNRYDIVERIRIHRGNQTWPAGISRTSHGGVCRWENQRTKAEILQQTMFEYRMVPNDFSLFSHSNGLLGAVFSELFSGKLNCDNLTKSVLAQLIGESLWNRWWLWNVVKIPWRIPLKVDLDGVSLSLTGVSLYKGCLSQQVMLGGCQHQTALWINHNQYLTYSCIYGIIT